MAGNLQFLIESNPFYAICVTGVTVALLLWASPRSCRWWLLGALALLPVALIYILGADNRVYSFHGFQHQSIAYQILEGVIPPVNPLLAGEPLLYTWMPHLIVGKLGALFSVAPSSGFAIANLLALVVTLVFLYKAALAIAGDKEAAVLGVVFAIFGTQFKYFVFLLAPDAQLNFQALPPVMKFTNMNPMPYGIMCFAVFLYSLTRILAKPSDARIGNRWLFASVLGAALLYPIHWLGIMAAGAVAIGILFVTANRALRTSLLQAGASATLASICALPYLLSITQSETHQSVLHLADARHIAAWSMSFFVPALPLVALLAISHRKLRKIARNNRSLFVVLGSVVIVNAILCIFIAGLDEVSSIEYKYRTLSYIPISLAVGIAIQGREKRQLALVALILGLMFYPNPFSEMYCIDARVVRDPYYLDGVALRHADPDADELHRWILNETPPRAAFVDSYLTIPAFARRSLFVGLDLRRQGDTEFVWDGWHYPVEVRLQRILGGNPVVIEKRIFAAERALRGRDLDVAAQIFDDELERTEIDGIYVVQRRGPWHRALDGNPRFSKVFENRSATVYRFEAATRE